MKQLLSVANMKKSDDFTTQTIPAVEMMARAGKGIFDTVAASDGWRAPVAVVCGIGNNAGDGFALAELLAKSGIECEIFTLSDRVSDTSRPFYEHCVELGISIRRGIGELKLDGFATVVDCLLGIGLRGKVEGELAEAIARINASGAYVISADINSGLNGDSGLPSPIAVISDLTISVGQYKAGHFLGAAKDFINARANVEIGIEPLDVPAMLIESGDIAPLFERTKFDVHKGDFGYVALIGGSLEYSGAAKLANLALSSLRAGAGVAKLAVPRTISHAVLPYLLESTLFALESDKRGFVFNEDEIARLIRGVRSISVGMGMGRSPELARLISYLLANFDGRLIIDADGLNELAELDRELIRNAKAQVILTPHPKEFERLSGITIAEMRQNPIKSALEYAREVGVTLLLKGTATVVTDGDAVYVIDRGTPGMSTAGSGDVLSGILAGVCAPIGNDSLALAVAAGAYLNGLAGELAAESTPPCAMLSSDTVAAIPETVKRILSE